MQQAEHQINHGNRNSRRYGNVYVNLYRARRRNAPLMHSTTTKQQPCTRVCVFMNLLTFASGIAPSPPAAPCRERHLGNSISKIYDAVHTACYDQVEEYISERVRESRAGMY